MVLASGSEQLASFPGELAAANGRSECPHCQEGPQFYSMLFGLYKFDVDLALAIARDGRECIELAKEDVKYSLDWSVIHTQHLEHVDMRFPGIVSHYWYREENGTVLHGHVLIDGHHRAAKAAQLDVPFYVYVLTEEESKKVTLRAPAIDGAFVDDRSRHVDGNR